MWIFALVPRAGGVSSAMFLPSLMYKGQLPPPIASPHKISVINLDAIHLSAVLEQISWLKPPLKLGQRVVIYIETLDGEKLRPGQDGWFFCGHRAKNRC